MASESYVQDLVEALRVTQEERDARKAAIDAEYAGRIDGLRRAIHGLDGNGNGYVPSPDDRQSETVLSVGDDKLDYMREYVIAHPVARQADVARALQKEFDLSPSSASGAASTGMRRLEIEGLVHPGRKQGGSNTWHLVEQAVSAE